jgi:hypothetical protein
MTDARNRHTRETMKRTTAFPRRSLLMGTAALTAAMGMALPRASAAARPTVTVHKDPT